MIKPKNIGLNQTRAGTERKYAEPPRYRRLRIHVQVASIKLIKMCTLDFEERINNINPAIWLVVSLRLLAL